MDRHAPPGDDPSALADAIATTILASLQPLRFDEVDAADGREACLRLRYRAVLEMRMAPAEWFPDGLESDEYDAGAVHILGSDAGRPIATTRIVLPTPGRLLPVEAAFGLRVSSPSQTVELGRLVVDPDYRGDGHSVFMGLAARAWLALSTRGYTTVAGATPARLVALIEALGFTLTALDAPRRYWGEERWPIVWTIGPAVGKLERFWLAGDDVDVGDG
jgi:GNAT superfamily N-acetyltransferase